MTPGSGEAGPQWVQKTFETGVITLGNRVRVSLRVSLHPMAQSLGHVLFYVELISFVFY